MIIAGKTASRITHIDTRKYRVSQKNWNVFKTLKLTYMMMEQGVPYQKVVFYEQYK